jgi:hypothetical protein
MIISFGYFIQKLLFINTMKLLEQAYYFERTDTAKISLILKGLENI